MSMTGPITPDDIARPEPKRDRWGRYIALGPDGKPGSYTRATTVAKALEDQHNLSMWRCRKVLEGAAMRKDIVTQAQAHDVETDRSLFDQLVQKALDAAQSDAGANTGTALHRMTEDLDSARKTIADIPDEWRDTLTIYRQALEAAGVVIDPHHIEQVVLNDDHRIAGTVDRVVTLADGRRVIADLKTSKNVQYSSLAIAVQLAIYANHTATYDYGLEQRGDRIDVDTDIGLVIHLPSQGPEHGTCTIYTIDLREGAQAMLASIEARDMRNDSRNWLHIYRPINAGTGGATAQADWLRDRIANLAGNGAAVAQLVALWPAGITKPLPAELPTEQVDDMAHILDTVEATHQIAFGPTRPGVEQATPNTPAKDTAQ